MDLKPDSSPLAPDRHSKLDDDFMRCLDSVHHLLSLRDSVSQLLRQGWMEMAKARYSMGPSRVSQLLFSLKPYAASASVAVTSPGAFPLADDNGDARADSKRPLHMTLRRLDTGESNTHLSSNSHTPGNEQSIRQDLDHSKAIPTDWIKDEDAAYKRLMADVGDSGSDSESEVTTQPTEKTRPLRWFGAFVSPISKLHRLHLNQKLVVKGSTVGS